MAKVLKWFSWFAMAILLVVLIVPFVLKNKVIDLVKLESNKRIHGQLDFKDLDISLIKSFPFFGLSLDQMVLTDNNRDTIFSAESLALMLHLRKLISSNFKEIDINKIKIVKPFLNSKFDKAGIYNLSNIMKSQSNSPSTSTRFETNIKKIEITNGWIKHNDSSSNYTVSLQNLDLVGKGNIVNQKLDLNFENFFDHFTYVSDGITLLKNAKINWNGNLLFDLSTADWTIRENEIELNALKSKINGDISSTNKIIDFNLDINIPKNNLKDLISLIPGAYAHQFDNLTAAGEFDLIGSIKGKYDSIGHKPMFKISTLVREGSLKYKHLPYSISKLGLDLVISSLDSIGHKYQFKLPALKAYLNNQPIEMQADILYNQGYITNAAGNLKAILNLEDIEKLVPLENATYQGHANIDLDFSFNESDLLNKNFDKMKLNGKADGNELKIKLPGYPAVSITKIASSFQPKTAQIFLDQAQYGNSDFSGKIDISNPIALFTKYKDQSLITTSTTSRIIDLNEITNWVCDTCNIAQSSEMNESIPLLRLNTSLTANKIKYHDFIIGTTTLSLTKVHDSIFLKNVISDFNSSNLSLTGSLYNPYSWSFGKKPLSGKIYLTSNDFDFNAYLDTTTKSSSPSISYVPSIPANTDLNISFKAMKARYNQYLFSNFDLAGSLNNQTFLIENGKASFAGGNLILNGVFSEVNPLPEFDFKLDLNNMNIEDAIKTSSSFVKMAPLARFMGGLFSTSSVFQGSLDADLNPVWKKFDAAGVLEIINAKLSQFKPLEELFNKIQIPILKNIDWGKSKNWFAIEKGVVNIKPFVIPNKDIFIQMQGSHEIEQNIDYLITLGIPKKVFDKYKVNPYLNTDFKWLRDELTSKGIPIQEIDTFYFQTFINGHISNPTTVIKWVAKPGGKTYSEQLKEDIEAAIKQKTDSIKQSIETKAESKKDSVLDLIKKEVNLKKEQLDSITTVVQDSLKKIAQAKAKELIDSVIRKETAKVLDSSLQSKVDTLLGKKAKEEIEKINEKLKNWNPLKKNKKAN